MPDVGNRSPHWAKVQLLRQQLPDYDFCLWVDVDFVIRSHEDVLKGLRDEDMQGMVMEQTPHHGVGPNSGLWILRNCVESQQFLDEVWETGPLPGATLNDQATIAHLMGFSYLPDYTRPVASSPWAEKTSWLPLQWNMLEIFHPEAYLVAKAIHFGGLDNKTKLREIKRQLVRDKLPGWDHGRC